MGLVKNFSRHRATQPDLAGGQKVRACFGLTQQQLALLLGVSREVLAADETGRRYLMGPPGRLLDELAQVVRSLPPVEASPPPPASEMTDYDFGALRLRLMAIGLEEYRLRRQLARCQTQLAQMRRRTQALPALRATLPADNTYAARWLTQLADDAVVIQRLEEPQEQLLLLRLRVLAFEAGETARLVGETGPTLP